MPSRTCLRGVAAGLAIGLLAAGVARVAAPPIHAADTIRQWLPADDSAAIDRVETQLRGLDVAMWEIGHRFGELHQGGLDRNWPYAEYQLEKIGLALRLAVERRPKRAASARSFLDDVLPEVDALVKRRDPEAFRFAMDRLRAGCMQCHVAEEVPHFIVELPANRRLGGAHAGPPDGLDWGTAAP